MIYMAHAMEGLLQGKLIWSDDAFPIAKFGC